MRDRERSRKKEREQCVLDIKKNDNAEWQKGTAAFVCWQSEKEVENNLSIWPENWSHMAYYTLIYHLCHHQINTFNFCFSAAQHSTAHHFRNAIYSPRLVCLVGFCLFEYFISFHFTVKIW